MGFQSALTSPSKSGTGIDAHPVLRKMINARGILQASHIGKIGELDAERQLDTLRAYATRHRYTELPNG